jgi:Zn-dependent protease
MEANLIVLGITWFVVFLFSTTLHEAAHALAAYRLGDPTAYHGGQVTLSPFPHMQREPFGMVLVPLVSFFLSRGTWMMGWASAPYDPIWAHRHPRRAAWMALAGPLSNLLLVLLAGTALRIGMAAEVFSRPTREQFSLITLVGTDGGLAAALVTPLSIVFSLNLILFVFNLLPLPPLDGSAVIAMFLSDELARRYQEFLRQPYMALAGLLLAWKLFNPIFQPILILALVLLYPG